MVRIIYNPDKEVQNQAREALKANDYYCPCALVRDIDTRCMCKDFRDKMTDGYIGECNCGLYVIERTEDEWDRK